MSYNLKCEECEKDFVHSQHNTKTCSLQCHMIRTKKKYGRVQDYSIPSGTVGAMSELAVSIDLLKKGYAVFRSLSPACFCDVVIIKDEKVLRVEIRTGYEYPNGRVSFPRQMYGKIDVFGIYDRKKDKCFYFNSELEKIEL